MAPRIEKFQEKNSHVIVGAPALSPTGRLSVGAGDPPRPPLQPRLGACLWGGGSCCKMGLLVSLVGWGMGK